MLVPPDLLYESPGEPDKHSRGWTLLSRQFPIVNMHVYPQS